MVVSLPSIDFASNVDFFLLYVPFLAEKKCDYKCASWGGGQRSMVKYHIFTFFLPFPYINNKILND